MTDERPEDPWFRIGEVGNPDAARFGKPLDGIRVLAVEQMAALPFATQLLARLGAEVIKVEHPVSGESGRGSLPAMTDPEGRLVGATFLRSNSGKRSVGIDLKTAEGRDLVAELAGRFDVFAENYKPGTLDRLGLGYETLSALHPRLVYASVSGFGSADVGDGLSPYRTWPAYASVVEAMSGIYEFKRRPDHPPTANPVGALGDISSALFAVIGVLAALRHREQTGLGQHVDVAMLDATVALTDIVANFASMGIPDEEALGVGIIDTFAASDGHFVLQVVREHHFATLAVTVGHPEWAHDPRFAERRGWTDHLDSVIRPGVEAWARGRTKFEAARDLSAAGLACGPSLTSAEVIRDPHLAARRMLVAMPRTDGVDEPVLFPGNPVKLSRVSEGPENRVPWVGEHTFAVLSDELGLDTDRYRDLVAEGVLSPPPAVTPDAPAT